MALKYLCNETKVLQATAILRWWKSQARIKEGNVIQLCYEKVLFNGNLPKIRMWKDTEYRVLIRQITQDYNRVESKTWQWGLVLDKEGFNRGMIAEPGPLLKRVTSLNLLSVVTLLYDIFGGGRKIKCSTAAKSH